MNFKLIKKPIQNEHNMAMTLEEKTKHFIEELDSVPEKTKGACQTLSIRNKDRACLVIATVFCLHPRAMNKENRKLLDQYTNHKTIPTKNKKSSPGR
jgi:hypothetical protein